MRTSNGKTAVARPLLDLGFDGYARRVGTLRVLPYHVKSRRALNSLGLYTYVMSHHELVPDPTSAILFTHLSPQSMTLFRNIFVIPVDIFLARCRVTPSGNLYFSAHMDEAPSGRWKEFLFLTDRLQADWLERLPGWSDNLPARPQPYPAARTGTAPQLHEGAPVFGGLLLDRHSSRLHKRRAELFVAGQVQSAGAHRLVVARDRVRLDAVSLLLHNLDTFQIAALSIQTAFVGPDGIARLQINQKRLFVDDRLWLMVVICLPDGNFHHTCHLIPSATIPSLMSWSSNPDGAIVFVDEIPLAEIPQRYQRFLIPIERLGHTVVDRVFKRWPLAA
jgi:hypothetical protein